jgi:hypothetical protein
MLAGDRLDEITAQARALVAAGRGRKLIVMAQIGCPSLDQLGPDFLWRDDWTRTDSDPAIGQARQITIPSITILAGSVMFGINPN